MNNLAKEIALRDRSKLIQYLKNCEIFSSLDYEVCVSLVSSFLLVELKQGEILFNKNDESDGFYIIVSGKLEAVLINVENSGIDIISTMYPGEPVGELGALSDTTRSLTVRAAKDSSLLKMSSANFKKLCHDYPSILFEIVTPIIRRSQKTIELLNEERKINIVLILPANEATNFSLFKQQLADNVNHLKDTILLTDSDIEVMNPIKAINEKNHNRHWIVCLESSDHEIISEYLKICDSVYFVAQSNTNYVIQTNVIEILLRNFPQKKYELILVHPENNKQILNTKKWLEKADFNLHHHVYLSNQGDYQRILRFMMGDAHCLVLGGGAGKGWVHLGVLQALIENDFAIDVVGGTSIGAVAAACYIIGETIEKIAVAFKQIVDGATYATTVRELTWPSISFMSAKHGTEAICNIFGDVLIEDLRIPFFCTSSNLSSHSLSIHKSGSLWRSVRASASMPGIVPPMVLDGQIHMDGGLLNNLPIDIMKGLVGLASKIIGVKLSNNDIDKTIYDFPPIMTFENIVLNKISPNNKRFIIPPYFDTLLNAFLLGASAKETQNTLLADILINPNLTGFSQYNVNENQRQQLIKIGYDEMMSYLPIHK